MVTSSLMPGVATAKYWNILLPESRSAIGLTLIWIRRYSSSACWGSMEIVHRSVADLHLLEVAVLAVEGPGNPVLVGDLGHDRAPPAPRRRQPERGGDGRLPDPSFAGHEDQPLIEQFRHAREEGIGGKE